MAKHAPSRPPSFPSYAVMAAELDMSETQVRELVKQGVLPKPIPLSSGCVRFDWQAVLLAIRSKSAHVAKEDAADPFMTGADLVTQKER